MFGQSKRTDLKDAITAGATAIGETSRVIQAVVVVASLALVIAVVALVVAIKKGTQS